MSNTTFKLTSTIPYDSIQYQVWGPVSSAAYWVMDFSLVLRLRPKEPDLTVNARTTLKQLIEASINKEMENG